MATATANKPTTTTLHAMLQADGSIVYSVPKRDIDKLMKAYGFARACAHFPALKENAEAAMKGIALLMLDLGIETDK